MAESVNQHYEKLLENMNADKDSIFEPCRVLDFDTKTLMATTRGIRSKSVKKNVITLFPSMFMNTGLITFPVKESVGLCFLGIDGESYLLPTQFFPPVKSTQDSSVSSNASPGQLDELLSLENVEPGELLLRSLGGAQVYIRNTGEVEMATSKMHRISLSEIDGSMETVLEKSREYIGFFESFNGVHENADGEKEHHIFTNYFEGVPEWDTDEVLPDEVIKSILEGADINDFVDSIADHRPIAKTQKVNVYDDNGVKKVSSVDGAELFYDFDLFREFGDGAFTATLSKEGSLETTSTSADGLSKTTVTQSPLHCEMKVISGGTVTGITISETGGVEISDKKGTYSLADLFSRISQLESNG